MASFAVMLVMGNTFVGLLTVMFAQVLSDHVVHDYTGIWSVLIVAGVSAVVVNLGLLWFFGFFSRKKEKEKNEEGAQAHGSSPHVI